MDPIILLVILGVAISEGESLRNTEQPYQSRGNNACDSLSKYFPNEKVSNIECLESPKFICKRSFTNPACRSNDPEYKFNKDTQSCHKYHVEEKIWTEAFKICHSEGSYLAIVNSDDEAKLFVDLNAKKTNSDYFLLGFHQFVREEFWVDVKGKPLSESGYMKWAPGEPNKMRGQEHFGSMHRDGGLNDIEIIYLCSFICERDI